MEQNFWTRRRMSRRNVLRAGAVGAAGLSAAALIGCGDSDTGTPSTATPGGGAAPTATPGSQIPAAAPLTFKRGGVVRMGTPALTNGLDPHFSPTGYHKTRVAFDTPLDFDENGVPAIKEDSLAESVEQVDPTTILMKLKPGVKFHDGTAFNAEAVKWNITRSQGPEPVGGRPHRGEILFIERVEPVDELTARFILKQPDAGIFTAFTNHSTQMLSPTHYDGKPLADVEWKPVGTGRYMFKEYSQDAFIKYAANPEYFHRLADGGPAGMVDELHELAIPDAIARAAALQGGDVEMLDESPATQLDILNADQNLTGVKVDGFAIRTAYINHGLAPLDNVDFRRALMWAWDPVAQNNLFDNGIGTPATSFLSPLFQWAHIDVPTYPGYDLEKAKQYMEASGIPEAERKIKITGNPQYFAFLQDAWAKIGVQSEHVADATGRLNRNVGDTNLDVHMSVGSRITSRPDPGWQTNVMMRSDAVYNYGWAPTGKMDELSDRGLATYDIEERKAIYKEAQELHADQLYCHFTVVNIPFWVHGRKPLAGFRHFATGRGDYRYVHFTA